jgi:hypothetical protein
MLMNFNVKLAAAVAAVLGTGAAFAQSGVPTLAQIEAVPATNVVYITGSSAAKNAVLADIEANICGGAGNYYNFTSAPNGNFFAISCTPVAAVNASNAGVYNIFYRDEGGSVTGYLPIVNAVTVNQLVLSAANLTAAGCGAAPPCALTVNGVSTGNGVDDSFSGSVGKVNTDFGIGDVEPAALTGNNYPSAYSTTVWGPTNPSGLLSLAGTDLFAETYALFVNELTAPANTTFTESPLLLSVQTVQNILTHKIKNWSLVTDVNGAAVVNGPLAITIVNREKGSGSRAATDLLIAGDCDGHGVLFDAAGATDYFATSDVLNAANVVAGGITYATVDQSATNLVKVSLNGVAPTNENAATGAYPFWVEAQFVINPSSTADPKVMDYLTSVMQTEATAPHVADVLAIPGVPAGAGNVAHSVLANSLSAGGGALGTANIWTNPFTRAGVTCNAPSAVSAVQ